MKDLQIVPAKPDYAEEISNKQIRAAVEIPAGFRGQAGRGRILNRKNLHVRGRIEIRISAPTACSDFSANCATAPFANISWRGNLPENLARPFDILEKNVAPPEKVGGAVLGGLVPYFVILLCLTGAMYPAMDLTAGEKERGTIETILCSPVSRTHLVLGKFLMVLDGVDRHSGSGYHLHGAFLWRGKAVASRHHARSGGSGPANHHHRQKPSFPYFSWCFRSRFSFPRPCWRFHSSRKVSRKRKAIFRR